MGNALCTNMFLAVVYIITEENTSQTKRAAIKELVKYMDIICVMNNHDLYKELVMSWGILVLIRF